MPRRIAFLIGNQNFRDDSGLTPLEGPSNDVAALARLLRDPERGNFEVHKFLDKASYEINPEIEQALNKARLGTTNRPYPLRLFFGRSRVGKNKD